MEELLPHDVIEHQILEKLDWKAILKFKSVSKQWKSTIQSPSFQKRHLIHHRSQSRKGSHVLLVSAHDGQEIMDIEDLRPLVVGSSVFFKNPTPWENKLYDVCNTTCDGLICLYDDIYVLPSIIVNPTTQWQRTFPLCNFQLVSAERRKRYEGLEVTYPSPGFGKDKINGTYKPVWLYNSAELGLNDKTTTCEVFDFATNSWRYIVPASPHMILHNQDPVYVDGSLHWFTASSNEGETMVLSLDLHTETFQVISKAPFLHAYDELKIVMCNMDDRLWVSEKKWTNQVIWSLDVSDHKTWKKIYSINLNITFDMYPNYMRGLSPLAVVDKDRLLLYDRESGNALVKHDPNSKSYDYFFTSQQFSYFVCYCPSLMSIL